METSVERPHVTFPKHLPGAMRSRWPVSTRARPQKTKLPRCHHGPDPLQQMFSLQFSSSLCTRDADKESQPRESVWLRMVPSPWLGCRMLSADMSTALCEVRRPSAVG